MIIGLFFGKTVKAIERRIGQIQAVEERILHLKDLGRNELAKALSDRYAAMGEIQKDLAALQELRGKLS